MSEAKVVSKKVKLTFVLYMNIIPFVISLFFYEYSVDVDLCFMFWAIIALIVFNCLSYTKPLAFLLTELFLILCIIVRGQISTMLYYNNVSMDDMSLAIGGIAVIFEIVLTLFATAGITLIKHFKNKNHSKR